MKKLFKTIAKISLVATSFFIGSFAFAQTTASTSDYISRFTIYQPSNTLVGYFESAPFFDQNDVNSNEGNVVRLMSSSDNLPSSNDKQLTTFSNSTRLFGRVPFEVTDHNFSSSSPDKYVYLRYLNDSADVQTTNPVDVSSDWISVSNIVDFTQPLLVGVNWDRSLTSLENTQADNKGSWFYRVSTGTRLKDRIIRSRLETIFLTAKDTSGGDPFDLCTFEGTWGSGFLVSYPECALQDERQEHNFLPGKAYQVYFTDGSGNLINAGMPSDGKYTLPRIPGTSLPLGIIQTQAVRKDHPSGGKYFDINATISETLSGKEFTLSLRSNSTGAFVDTLLGTIPVTQGSVSLPSQMPQTSLAEGVYELVVSFEGATFQVSPLGRIGGSDTANGNTGGSTGVVLPLNATQIDIMDNGLVPDCGYNIRTQARPDGIGKMCGLTDAIILIQRIIEYIFFLVLPIAAIVFAYVGYLYLTSGGDAAKRTKAKSAMGKLVLGIIVIMGAWFLVKTILTGLGVDTGIAGQFLDLDS